MAQLQEAPSPGWRAWLSLLGLECAPMSTMQVGLEIAISHVLASTSELDPDPTPVVLEFMVRWERALSIGAAGGQEEPGRPMNKAHCELRSMISLVWTTSLLKTTWGYHNVNAMGGRDEQTIDMGQDPGHLPALEHKGRGLDTMNGLVVSTALP
jgi:hypothetical protein